MDFQGPLVPFKNQGWDQEPGRSQCLLLGLPHPPRRPIYIFSYRVIYVITLSYYVKIFGSIPNSRQSPPWLLEKIIWNCVLSRIARLYTVITQNVPGKAICVFYCQGAISLRRKMTPRLFFDGVVIRRYTGLNMSKFNLCWQNSQILCKSRKKLEKNRTVFVYELV